MNKGRGPGWSPQPSSRKKNTLSHIMCLVEYPYSRRNSSAVKLGSYLVGLDARHSSPTSYAHVQLDHGCLAIQGARIIWFVMLRSCGAVSALGTASSSASAMQILDSSSRRNCARTTNDSCNDTFKVAR